MSHPDCPADDALHAFQLGDLPEPHLSAVAGHLETCRRCEETAGRLDSAVDPVLAALRDPSSVVDDSTRHVRGKAARPSAGSPFDDALPEPDPAYPFLLPPAAADELGRLAGYRVLRLLDRGGMGYVFHAVDVALDRPVALKVMRPDLGGESRAWDRFVREARLMAAIKHDHVVGVYQAGQERDVVYLAMELLRGETLRDRLTAAAPLPADEVVRVAREAAVGLRAVPRHGLVHRDLKPGNLWLEAGTGRVKLLDFGLARFAAGDVDLTHSGVVVGTPSFMSPEQARGDAVDARSDLFSLGAVLYCACAGEKPFPGETATAVLTALAVTDPRPPHAVNPAVPRQLSALVLRLLAKDPADRPQSADELIERLDALDLTAAAPADDAAGPPVTPASRVRRRWRRAGVATLVAAAAVGGFFAVAGAIRPATPPPAGVYDPVPGAVYLRDLTPASAKFFPFVGHLPEDDLVVESPDWPEPAGGRRVVVGGWASPRGIFMHLPPVAKKVCGVTFQIDRRYATFEAGVALNDGPAASPPLTFTVSGDGKVLWRSAPVEHRADAQECRVSVADVGRLSLEVTSDGESEGGTHAVWIEPRLLP